MATCLMQIKYKTVTKTAPNPKMNVCALNYTAQVSYYHPHPDFTFKQKVTLSHYTRVQTLVHLCVIVTLAACF